MTALTKVVRSLSPEPVSVMEASVRVAALASRGRLIHKNRLWVPRASSEERVRRHIRAGTYSQLVEAVNEADPRRGFYGYGSSNTDLSRRQSRVALHQGDTARWDVLSANILPVDIADWFIEPFASDLLDGLLPPLRAAVVGAIAARVFLSASPAPEFWAYLARMLEREPSLPVVVATARQALFAGDPARAEDLLADVPEAHAWYAHAQLALFAGDIKTACKRYSKGLAQARSTTRHPEPYPTDPDAYLLPLAFLLDSGVSRPKQAKRMIVLPYQRDGGPWLGWRHLTQLVDAEQVVDDCSDHPMAVLLQGLMAWWRGKELAAGRAEAAAVHADAIGWGGVAEQLRLGVSGRSLVRLRSVQSDWERKLNAMHEVLGLAGDTPQQSAEGRKRLAWWVTELHGEVQLQPREQVRSTKGWSRGRPVALGRVVEGHPDATSADAAIVAAIRVAKTSAWGGTSQDVFSWSAISVWPALASHPAVFDASGKPVTIVMAKPRLIVSETAEGTQVRVSPTPTPAGLAVTPVGNGFEVTVFSADQLRVASVVGAGLVVPPEGQASLQALLSASETLFERTTGSDRGRLRDVPPVVCVRLSPDGGGVVAELVVLPMGPDGIVLVPGEGNAVVLVREDGNPLRLKRDRMAESNEAERLLNLPGFLAAEPHGDVWRLPSADACLELLEALRDQGIQTYWPEGADLRYRTRLNASDVSVSVRAAGSWFEASADIQVDDGLVLTLKELLESVLTSNGRFVQLKDGSWIALTTQLKRDLDSVARTVASKKGSLAVHPLAAQSVVELAQRSGGTVDKSVLKRVAELADIPDEVAAPPALTASLRAYQLEAYQWLVRLGHLGIGGILADDMGLGKTVTTLAALLFRQQEGPALVIAPTSVSGNWRHETQRFAPTLTVHLLRDAQDRVAVVRAAGPGDLVIASYGLLISEVALLSEQTWGTVVFDESQALKNPVTQRHKAAIELKAGLRIALTGTPIENHTGELHAQVSVVNPGMLGSNSQFRKRFQRPIERGDPAIRRQLRAMVSPYLLRRTKEQVLSELPPRTDIDVPVPPNDTEAALYEAQRLKAIEDMESSEEARRPVAVLAHLSRLRMLACSPALVLPDYPHASTKLIAFAGIVDRMIRGGHRGLVFSQFIKHLDLLKAYLDGEGISYQYLDGATPSRQRDRAVHTFQTGTDPLFLISTRAGGQGINLTAAETVIHMDPWWNPAVEDQASDRAHRMGQRRPVTVYRLFAQGTVEEEILKLHRTKRDLADGLLEGADAATRLTSEQLLGLMTKGI